MENRLNVLYEANVIDEDIKDACMNIHRDIFVEKSLHKKEAYETLMTHLAMASQRIKEGLSVDKMDAVILNELKDQDLYEESQKFYGMIQSYFSFELPEEEKDYITLHLLNLLQEE